MELYQYTTFSSPNMYYFIIKSGLRSNPKSFGAGCLQDLVIQPNSKIMVCKSKIVLWKTGLLQNCVTCGNVTKSQC